MINIDLTGKVILITGALGAIAKHLVRKFSLAGATLVLTDLQPEPDARRSWKTGVFQPFLMFIFS